MKKILLLISLCAVLLMTGCASEQTIVRKVNEPMALQPVEQLKPVESTWGSPMLLELAPDNQTALLWEDGRVFALRSGKVDPVAEADASLLPGASQHITWSPNCRYACWRMNDTRTLLIDLEALKTEELGAVNNACFNADQVTLFCTTPAGDGCTLTRRKVFETPSDVLDAPTVSGPMFRTTRSQYLCVGDRALYCLEQDDKDRSWKTRLVADFTPSGMAAVTDFSYSAQTGLCIVSGVTDDGYTVFSILSPDSENAVIDQVTVFSPLDTETPCRNLAADQLSLLNDENVYPVQLSRVQLSPGGLYLLLFGTAGNENCLYLLNLDTGKLTAVTLPEAWLHTEHAKIDWCSGKWLLLQTPDGNTELAALTGWDD